MNRFDFNQKKEPLIIRFHRFNFYKFYLNTKK